MGFRYSQEEIEELCKIPPWTDSSLDKQNKIIHEQVPLTRKCIVDQCLFWCDVAQRFKHNLHFKRKHAGDQTGTPAITDPYGEFIVGVVGCGSVGSKFVKELVKREIVRPDQIRISSRTPSRAKQRCGLEVIQNNVEVASHCTILFLFVLPFHFRNFSREIRDAIQGSRPLVVSSLAGFTPMYLQRALNTPFLITTGVDMDTIKSAATHLGEEFPLSSFATGEELVHFQEYFVGVFQEAAQANKPIKLSDEPTEPVPEDNKNAVNPFQATISNPKTLKKLHQASFAAESLANCGVDFLNSTINALKDWISLDPAYTRIQVKEETYNKLWARSFIPLSSLSRVESMHTSGNVEQQMPVRFMLKRAFIRSLLGNSLGMNVASEQNAIKQAQSQISGTLPASSGILPSLSTASGIKTNTTLSELPKKEEQ